MVLGAEGAMLMGEGCIGVERRKGMEVAATQ